MTSFSIKEAMTFAWRTFTSRPWLFVQAGLLLFLANIAVNLVQSLLEMGGEQGGDVAATSIALISAVIGVMASFLMSLGETNFFLRAHDNTETTSLKDLWHPESFWKFVGVSLLSGLAIFAGFILLIVPGIIAAILFMFVGYIVIEEKLQPIEAMKKSIAMTKGNRWKLFQLGLVIFGINILGFIALLVGLFVSIPVSFLAMAYVYRTLSKNEVAVEDVPLASA